MRENYTYNWEILSITKMNLEDNNNVIFKIIWRLIGIDPNGVEGVFKGSTELTLPDQFDDNFIEYENITQENIINWIQQILNMDDVYSAIDDDMEKNKKQIEIVFNGQYPWQQITIDPTPVDPSTILHDATGLLTISPEQSFSN
jgi:hypothetical protein